MRIFDLVLPVCTPQDLDGWLHVWDLAGDILWSPQHTLFKDVSRSCLIFGLFQLL